MLNGETPVGCGQCLPCRISLRRQWTWRQYLESLCHEENLFVTLTYDPVNLPVGGVVPRHCQLFLKRLRSSLAPKTFRFFLVGEYGEQTFRPHYHLSLFGLGLGHAAFVDRAWGLGHTHCAEFTPETAQYVAGYVVKKMTAWDDLRLEGLHPEFSRKSNRPGLGAAAMAVIANYMETEVGMNEFAKTGDVPIQLRLGRRVIPLGRYLRKKLRDEIGMPERLRDEVKKNYFLQKKIEMQLLLSDKGVDKASWFKRSHMVAEVNEQKIRNLEGRSRLHRKKDSL